MTDSSGESPEDTHSPCVRVFIRNFEQRDSSLGSGNDATRPPIMTKSKVKQLRENLRKTSDFVKRTDSDDGSSNDVQKPDDGDNYEADSGSERLVSVARLKESLQKSANEKHVAPWGFGGTGRPVKEPKKPFQNSNSDGEITEDRAQGDHSKRKINNSFKMAKTNLLDPFTKSEKSDGNASQDIGAGEDNSGRFDSLPSKFSSSDVILGRSSSRDEVNRPRVVPKVLPKPAARKSKTCSTKSRPIVSKDKQEMTPGQQESQERTGQQESQERTGQQESQEMTGQKESQEMTPGQQKTCDEGGLNSDENTSSGRIDILNSEVSLPVVAAHQDISSYGTISDEVNDSKDHIDTNEHLALDADGRDKMSPTEDNEGRAETDYALPVKKSDSQDDDFHLSISERADDNCCSSEDDSLSERNKFNEYRSHTPIGSSLTTTDVDAVDNETMTNNCKQHLNYDTAVKSESPSDNSVTDSDPVDILPGTHGDKPSNGGLSDLNRQDSIPLSEMNSIDETVFLDCMGSDFLSQITELCSVTIEEKEYDALSEIVCSKICKTEEDSTRWLLSPLESHRSAIDYVINLFRDEIFVDVSAKKSDFTFVDGSSFLVCDSLREILLDKATKKCERLIHQKQKLDILITKHDHFENEMKAIVKKKIETKYFCKYCSVIEDIDKVTYLLLMLSNRLANTDVRLEQISFTDDEHQKAQLIARRETLIVKYDEAVSLKDSIGNRRHQLTEHLKQRLPSNEFSDYQHFIKTKCQLKLLKQSIEDRLSLSNDQKTVMVDLIERNTSAKYC